MNNNTPQNNTATTNINTEHGEQMKQAWLNLAEAMNTLSHCSTRYENVFKQTRIHK